MAIYDKEYGKLYGVREYDHHGELRVDPQIIEQRVGFVSKLVENVSFDHIIINMPTQILSFFPSKKAAEDYLDAICVPID